MNENSKQKQPTVSSLIVQGKSLLDEVDISSSLLDAEILLAYTLGVDRAWLRAHDTDSVPRREELAYQNLINRRSRYEPVAYLTGVKEFYGREFKVTRDTLVPRPESENIITFLLEATKNNPGPSIIDIGTGSGALGITAKAELPNSKLLLTDISHQALEIARQNADKHSTEVGFVKTSLLDRLHLSDGTFILANLPYVDRSWDFLSKELEHEPATALFADNEGLKLIYDLLDQVESSTARNITLFIESDTSQQNNISVKLTSLGFELKNKSDYVLVALKK